jgi:hypothetical protein
MKHLTKDSPRANHINERATNADLRKLFTENMNSLYLLSFVLTRDQRLAHHCFVAGLEDSVASNQVFKQWAHHWAKQFIIQNAIRVLQPRPGRANASPAGDVFHGDHKQPNFGKLPPEMNTLLALRDFDRFVFVMSVLEHNSDHACSLLLGCSIQDIHLARARALEQIARPPHTAGSNESGHDVQEAKR